MQFLSHDEFDRCVNRFDGNRYTKRFSCWDQFLAMAFAQLTYRESLRDIEVCLAAQRSKLYHCGLSGPVRRSSLANANERRDWRIYADFAHTLIDIARPLYADTELGFDLIGTAYALDATTIDLCLSMFPWARFRRAKAAIKLHTMIEIQLYPNVYRYNSRQSSRRECPRHPHTRSRLIPGVGSRLSGLRSSVRAPSSAFLLRHPSQKQSSVSASVLSFGGHVQRPEKRPDWRLDC